MTESNAVESGRIPETQRGIRDRDAKFEAILRYARHKSPNRTWNLARLPEIFDRSVSSFENRAKNWNLGGSTPTGESREVFESMLRECRSTLNFDEFRLRSYSDFLRSIPPNIRRRLDPHIRIDSRLLFTIDPRHISHNPEDEWRASKVINQKYMYVTPFSASKWKELSESPGYQNSNLCRDTLAETIKHEQLNGIETVIFLGCGSPSKERMILDSLCGKSDDKIIRAIFIDASVFMLAYSANELIDSGAQENLTIFSEMYCIDFTQENQWEDNIEFTDRERKAFFLIGETIGNIDEYDFRSVINRFVSPDDIIIIGAEFFSSEEELNGCKDELLETYSKDSAKDLDSISDCLNRKGIPKRVRF